MPTMSHIHQCSVLSDRTMWATFLIVLAPRTPLPVSGDTHLLEGCVDLIPAVFLLLASKALKTSLSYITCLKVKTRNNS